MEIQNKLINFKRFGREIIKLVLTVLAIFEDQRLRRWNSEFEIAKKHCEVKKKTPKQKSNTKWGKDEERKVNAHIVFFWYFYLRKWIYWSFDTKIIESTKCTENKTREKTEIF